MGWIYLDAVGQGKHAGVETLVEGRGGALPSEIRPAHVAHEQRVPGQHEPRLLTTRQVGHEQADAVGGMSGRVYGLDTHRADGNRLAIGNRRVRIGGLRRRVDMDAGSRLGRQRLIAREMIGVDVGLDDMRQGQALPPGPGTIVVHAVPARVYHEGLTRLATPNQIGDAAGVLVDHLLEYHRLHLPIRPPCSARLPEIRPPRPHRYRVT